METLTPQQISGRLRASLVNISELWDDMLDIPGVTRSSGTSELTRPEATAALRREIHRELTVWCDLVHRHFPTSEALPHKNVPTMCDYLGRHSDKLAEAGMRALEGIEDSAEAITRFVYGTKKPPVALGPCPMPNCENGTIRATPDHDSEGRSLQRCDTCYEKHTTDEWLKLLHISRQPTLNADQLIKLAHQQFGIRISAHAIRCLEKRGTLKPAADGTPGIYALTEGIRYLTMRAANTPIPQ